MTDWTYRLGALIELGRRERANAGIRLGVYATAGRFLVPYGASAAGPVTHWALSTSARPVIAPLLPGSVRVAAEYSDLTDVEDLSEFGTHQTITRAGDMVAAWGVITRIVAGEWSPALEGAMQAWALAEFGLVPVEDFDEQDAAEATELVATQALTAWAEAQPTAGGQTGTAAIDAAFEDEIFAAIDAHLDATGADRSAILSALGTGRAAARALIE